MNLIVVVLFQFYILSSSLGPKASGIHLPLYRRGGRFSSRDRANLTHFSSAIARAEARYSRTYSVVEGNRIIRRWTASQRGTDDNLLSGAGGDGSWYTTLQVGTPPQTLEVDIDMLSPDFYIVMTTSGVGSKYDTFGSSSHEQTQTYAHPVCRMASDIFHLPTLESTSSPPDRQLENPTTKQVKLGFPICQAPKYTHHTLNPSGSILGLSPTVMTGAGDDNGNAIPSSSLSRLSTTKSLLQSLLHENILSHPLVHITLLTPTTGLLSLGNPPTAHLETIKITLEKQLSYLHQVSDHSDPDAAAAVLEAEIDGALNFAIPPGSSPESLFQWSDVGAGAVRGWHMSMLAGVWVDGVKVTRNQVVLFDVNCPVILAPWGIGESVYGGIGGAMRVESLFSGDYDGEEREEGKSQEAVEIKEHNAGFEATREDRNHAKGFWAIPCLNSITIEFEIAGWRFPAAGGRNGEGFNLGKVDVNDHNRGDRTREDESEKVDSDTGYCIGAIVESDMGLRQEWARSGMRNVWVLGEPFFRGLGVVFDFGDGNRQRGKKGGRVGLRKY